jgi:hypothetical protein
MDNLIEKVISLIKQIEISERDKPGADKKEKLFTILKAITSPQSVEENKDIIEYIIETTIYLSKIHVIAGINKNTCLPCIPKIGFR